MIFCEILKNIVGERIAAIWNTLGKFYYRTINCKHKKYNPYYIILNIFHDLDLESVRH